MEIFSLARKERLRSLMTPAGCLIFLLLLAGIFFAFPVSHRYDVEVTWEEKDPGRTRIYYAHDHYRDEDSIGTDLSFPKGDFRFVSKKRVRHIRLDLDEAIGNGECFFLSSIQVNNVRFGARELHSMISQRNQCTVELKDDRLIIRADGKNMADDLFVSFDPPSRYTSVDFWGSRLLCRWALFLLAAAGGCFLIYLQGPGKKYSKSLSRAREVAESFFGAEKRAWIPLLFSCLLFAFYLIKTFSPASNGGAMSPMPDALEYSMGCASLLESGRYGIQLDGIFHPSRYLPWFSAMICLPAVMLFHGDIFAAVYSIWACAAGSVMLVFLLGRKYGTWMTGLCAGSLLFLSPMFRPMMQLVMTEIPYIFFLLLLLAVWLKIVRDEDGRISWKTASLYAILAALAGAVRSSAFPMLILPWGYYMLKVSSWRKKVLLTALLAAPSCLILLGNFLYDHATFGSGFRNGYQYWCPVPYDYPSLVFSLSYVKNNLRDLVSYEFFPVIVCEIVVIGLAVLLYRKRGDALFDERKRIFTAEILFALTQGLILLFLYMPYFFTSGARFFMPFEALLVLPAITAMEILFQRWKILLRCGMVLLLGCGIWETAAHTKDRYIASKIAEELKQADRALPEDAVVISDDHCALFEYYFVKRTARRYIPFSRSQEYVSKVIAPVPAGPLDPPPRGPLDHMAEALLRSPTCSVPYRWAVREEPDKFRRILKERRVFILPGDFSQIEKDLRALFPDAAFLPMKEGGCPVVRMVLPDRMK